APSRTFLISDRRPSAGGATRHFRGQRSPRAAGPGSRERGSSPMSSGAASGRMYLIDAHSLIFQGFHAIPAMTSPAGLPPHALCGFTRDLLFWRTEKKPESLVCASARAEPPFRDELYADYKAHRPPMDDDLALQLPLIHELVEALGLPVLSHPRYEADDVLATVAAAAAGRALDAFLCTTD